MLINIHNNVICSNFLTIPPGLGLRVARRTNMHEICSQNSPDFAQDCLALLISLADPGPLGRARRRGPTRSSSSLPCARREAAGSAAFAPRFARATCEAVQCEVRCDRDHRHTGSSLQRRPRSCRRASRRVTHAVDTMKMTIARTGRELARIRVRCTGDGVHRPHRRDRQDDGNHDGDSESGEALALAAQIDGFVIHVERIARAEPGCAGAWELRLRPQAQRRARAR